MVREKHSQSKRDATLHMLVDTCVWLDLARQADGAKMAAILKELSNRRKIELLVPAIILDEFERNRAKVEAMMTRSISARFREVRKAVDEHGRVEGKQQVLAELDNITHQVPIVNELATQTFNAVLELLQSGRAIQPTAETKDSAVERALTRRAPFHREKNSVADALIMEMYGQAAKDASAAAPYCFVTHNTKDFSSVNGDNQHPHDDFTEFFEHSDSQYFTSLRAALTSHLPDDIEELDFEFDFYDEPRPLSEILPYLHKLEAQIWYNRHKNREHQISVGEITLVERWDPKNDSTTIAREIWEGTQKAAQKVEKEYGLNELGPWDDFEWGMLNGKMSAIRWMFGEDWESTLDI